MKKGETCDRRFAWFLWIQLALLLAFALTAAVCVAYSRRPQKPDIDPKLSAAYKVWTTLHIIGSFIRASMGS